jgi:hypothetical protein
MDGAQLTRTKAAMAAVHHCQLLKPFDKSPFGSIETNLSKF